MSHVAVIGGGIAGLETALRAERSGFDVTLVEPKDSMLFYPSAHKLLEGKSEKDFTIFYEDKFSDRNIERIQEKAESVDFEKQEVLTENETVQYDYLVIAVGSETRFYDIPGQEKACTMRFKEEPKKIYTELRENGQESVTIVGGGATGVEAVSSLLEMRREKEFELNLVHGGDNLLPQNSKKLSSNVKKSLSEKDVNLFLGKKAVEIKEEYVELDSEEKVESDLVLWAGGVKPSSFIEELQLQQDHGGLKVNNFMQTGKENVFAVGDNCSYAGKVNRALYGIFEAKTAAKNIKRLSEEKELMERNITWDPEIIYLGKRDSALEFGNLCFRGLIPSLIRTLGVEKRYLWTRKYLT